MSYFGTDPGDLTPDEMFGREPVPAPRPSETPLPCPFCGRKITFNLYGDIRCEHDDLTFRPGTAEETMESREQLIERWNARRSSSSPSGVPRDISHEIEINDGLDAKEQPNDIDRLLGLAHRAVRENRWGDAQMLIANIQHQRRVASSLSVPEATRVTVSDEAVERATHVYYQWSEYQRVIDAAKARFDIGLDWDLSAEKHSVQDRVRLLAVLLDFVEQSRVPSSEEAANSDTERLDWLATKTIEVRDVLRYGSRHVFFASPEEREGEPDRPSNLRKAIDAARVQGENSQ